MMKKLYLLAAAALTLAACTDEAYLGENKEFTNTDKVIGFNMSTPAMSRADITGKAAAEKLGNRFYVYGIKNEGSSTVGAGGVKADGTDANNVMNNYLVTYAEGSAFSTTSNTEGWEYVGNTLSAEETANVTPNAHEEETSTPEGSETPTVTVTPTEQTIKYWDWGATDYTFTAISAPKKAVEAGAITITKIFDKDESVYANGYVLKFKTINPSATDGTKVVPDVASVYIADRENIVKPTETKEFNRTDHNVYGGQVNFTFRSLGTKVRAAMYETVPGYTVTVNKMYGGIPVDETAAETSETNFIADCPNSTTPTDGTEMTATVTYIAPTTATPDPNKDVVNQPTVTFSDGFVAKNTLELGENIFAKASEDADAVQNPLKTTAADPTYDKADGEYSFVLPQEANTTDMKITVDYTLKCDATGEVIKVVGAKATVPYEYLQWKPNFSYTYLFKISDNTNGHTDPGDEPIGPEGLYPITFDAVVVDAGDGIAEYITTVSESSITTFGVDEDGKYVADADAYVKGTDIYATVMAGETPTVQTLTLGSATEFKAGNVNLLKITPATGTADSYITEAAVAEYFAENYEEKIASTATPKLKAVVYNKDDDGTTTYAEVVNKVPGEDGVDITSENNFALHVKDNVAAGWYAVQYIKKDATKKVVAEYEEADQTGWTVDTTPLKDYYYKEGEGSEYKKFADEAIFTEELKASTTIKIYTQKVAPVAPVAPKAQYKVFQVIAPATE